jgi:LmbE family N-acetylglucosaminyl deacetylase
MVCGLTSVQGARFPLPPISIPNQQAQAMSTQTTPTAVAIRSFQYTRLIDGKPVPQKSIEQALNADSAVPLKGQTWLFVSPHDDDLSIGAGLLMQAAVDAGVNVECLIVTDGCLGYCQPEQQDDIVNIRHGETIKSFKLLGIEEAQLQFLGFPDGGLTKFIGRRKAEADEPTIKEYTGLQNAFTYWLRELRPTRLFVPTKTDLHPDHQITHNELMISIFHASGKIWPELVHHLNIDNEPFEVPKVSELAVYCDFIDNPHLEIIGNDAAFDKKLDSIAEYKSQLQIAQMVEGMREAGAYEYVRDVEFRLYNAERYRELFKTNHEH